MQRFTCECGNVLFFGSSRCLKCSSDVGYDPQRGAMQRVKADSTMKRCQNGVKHNVCNWLLPASATAVLCVACRMNRTIPDLSADRNRMLWARMEMAKRRLIYTLLRLGISLPSKKDDPKNGLAFDIVSTLSNPTVTTGHLNGVITVNLEEADDTYRQFNRQQLGESSRTLLLLGRIPRLRASKASRLSVGLPLRRDSSFTSPRSLTSTMASSKKHAERSPSTPEVPPSARPRYQSQKMNSSPRNRPCSMSSRGFIQRSLRVPD